MNNGNGQINEDETGNFRIRSKSVHLTYLLPASLSHITLETLFDVFVKTIKKRVILPDKTISYQRIPVERYVLSFHPCVADKTVLHVHCWIKFGVKIWSNSESFFNLVIENEPLRPNIQSPRQILGKGENLGSGDKNIIQYILRFNNDLPQDVANKLVLLDPDSTRLLEASGDYPSTTTRAMVLLKQGQGRSALQLVRDFPLDSVLDQQSLITLLQNSLELNVNSHKDAYLDASFHSTRCGNLLTNFLISKGNCLFLFGQIGRFETEVLCNYISVHLGLKTTLSSSLDVFLDKEIWERDIVVLENIPWKEDDVEIFTSFFEIFFQKKVHYTDSNGSEVLLMTPTGLRYIFILKNYLPEYLHSIVESEYNVKNCYNIPKDFFHPIK
jgi:hypothetical protein